MTAASPFETVCARVKGAKPNGRGVVARCPAHTDEHRSLSIHEADDGKVLLKCHAGCTADDIVGAIGLTLADLFPRKGGEGSSIPANTVAHLHTPPPGLTLAAYAEAKRLPIAFLQGLGLADVRLGSGRPAVRVPYRDATGKEAAIRYRHALTGGNRFTWKKGSKPLLYGAWNAGSLPPDVLLVEGESDCHTLWHHGFAALGLPGASAWKEERDLDLLAKVERVFVVIEPDRGGEAVMSWLAKSALRERAQLVHLDGAKDVSELHLADPEQLKVRLKAAMQAAAPFTQVQARQQAREASDAWTACQHLAEQEDILAAFSVAFRSLGAVGEDRIARILYLALTSRFLARPVSVAVKGPSSGGKSFTTDTVVRFFPAEAVYHVTAMSERALAYTDAELAHRFIYIAEAAGISGDMQTYLIRTLLSEGKLVYEVVEKTAEGIKPRRIEKQGPTGLLVTTTAVRLHPENETRLLSLHVLDTREQTAAVMAAIARGGVTRIVDLAPWLALQTWLARAEHRVVIPYATRLAELIPPVAVRLRRDFGALLALVRAHAILHQTRRERDTEGRIVAALTDYAVVRELVAHIVAEGVEATVPATVRETVKAVQKIIAKGSDGALVNQIAAELRLDRSAASRRAQAAAAAGYLRNDEDKRGRPARYELGEPMPDEQEILPRPEAVQVCSCVEGVRAHTPPAPDVEELIL